MIKKFVIVLAILLTLLTGTVTAEGAAAQINAGDTAWLFTSTALVMLMVPGVGLFYGGMVRRKNALSTLMLVFATMALVSIVWVVYGYSLSFGTDIGGFIGGLDYIGLKGVGMEANGTVPHLLFMMFQGMFAIIAVALIVGGIVERLKFSAWIAIALLWATFVYSPVAHWVWGGGFIGEMGALDFAGGTVVHINAGISALAIVTVLGSRKGFGKEPMEPHNIPMTLLGTALLWFGWFGFNAGSALGANGTAAIAFVNTNTSAAAGALAWMFLSWKDRAPSVLGIATGAVAGLVAITPAAGFVTPMAAIPIGAGAGIICYHALLYRISINVDESLDVLAVHGIGGTWGAIATGIFASVGATGLLNGNPSQLIVQVIGVLVTYVYAFAVTYILAKAVDMTIGLRVTEDEEAVGLDMALHGERAYA